MPSPYDPPPLVTRALARRFGARWVLRGVDLTVHAGEVVALFGDNGAGKSTLLRVCATLLRSHAGSATVAGFDVQADADAVRTQVAFLGHDTGLYDDLTARENIAFAATMLGAPHPAVAESLERVGLMRVADERVRGFSAGMRRRVALARVLLQRPRLLLLDEPYANLDAQGVALVNTVIRDALDAGSAALLVLHEVAPAAELLTRRARLVDGRIAEAA
ncbi:MAG: heme ABC exporter ATP-binding protein CcmA [Gemmatimonadaceae bacterium]|nr:heme ABC exporter ATP-binding protein CcmA [Gemmatimonadaceae bacterium]